VKALTILQPWASLIAGGAKRIETRSWYTPYRGPIAIHAGKRLTPDVREWLAEDDELAVDLWMGGLGMSADALPLGCVLATATLTHCVRFERGAAERIRTSGKYPEHETAYGDFAAGRFGWVLADVVPLPDPIPARGQQGLWEWEGNADG